MRDFFGDDSSSAISEGAPAATPPVTAAAAMAATPVPVTAPPAAAIAATPPTLQQAVDKAVAKAAADVKVAIDPNAVHSVKMAPLAPTVLGSTAVGAIVGSAIFPGPGTAVGAGVGWLAERYQIGGGPVGRMWNGVKGQWHKFRGSGWMTTQAVPPAAPVAVATTSAASATLPTP